MMKLAVTVNAWLDEELMYAQQLGADQVVAQLPPGEAGTSAWEKVRLAALRNRVEKAGLELLGLDGAQAFLDPAVSGEAALLQESQFFCELIANAAGAGIGLIAYRWCDPQQNWDNLADFLDRVIPTAEEVGVRLAGDFSSPAALGEGYLQICEQVLDLWPSLLHGLDLNPGLVDPRNGAVHLRLLLRKPGFRERIFLITPGYDSPAQTSVGAGDDTHNRLVDLSALLAMFHQAGTTASVRPTRQPGIPGNLDLDYQEQAYAAGTLRGILQVMRASV